MDHFQQYPLNHTRTNEPPTYRYIRLCSQRRNGKGASMQQQGESIRIARRNINHPASPYKKCTSIWAHPEPHIQSNRPPFACHFSITTFSDLARASFLFRLPANDLVWPAQCQRDTECEKDDKYTRDSARTWHDASIHTLYKNNSALVLVVGTLADKKF